MIHTSVGVILRHQHVISVSPRTSVREAAMTMAENDIGALPVIDGDVLVGIFTERDVMRRAVATVIDLDHTPVACVMTTNPHTISPDCSVVKALDLMVESRFRHLPVVDGGRVVGILSMRNVPLSYRLLHENWSSKQTTTVPPIQSYG
jgi:CBS domain-containing protein